MAAAVAACAIATGCAGRSTVQSPHTVATAALQFLDPAPIAFPGEPLVIAVAPTGKSDPGGRLVRAQLEDGRELKAELHRLHASERLGAPHWLADFRRWRAGAPTDAELWPPVFTLDVLVVDLPADSAGTTLQVGGVQIMPDWRQSPIHHAGQTANSIIPPQLHSPSALRRLSVHVGPAQSDPMNRWRARLLQDRLVRNLPESLHLAASAVAGPPLASMALEALARQIEQHWRLALNRVAAADPNVAKELVEALTRVVALGEEQVAPAWTPVALGGASSGLDQLLAALLDESLSDVALLARVDAWLATERRAVAFVLDDAGAADPESGLTLPQFTITDLSGRGGVARAALDTTRPGPRITVTPLESGIVVASGDVRQTWRRGLVELGDWRTELTVAPQPIQARPPGARLFPFFRPWSHESWLTGAPEPEPGVRATAASLRRRTNGSWEIYFECKTAPGQSSPNERLRLFFGPTAQPRAIIQIDPRGFSFDELETTTDDAPPARHPIVVQRAHDRWMCTFPIPDELIEAGRFLRLGVERSDDAGHRSTWPRPVMPWAESPGRAMFDLGDWLELERTLR